MRAPSIIHDRSVETASGLYIDGSWREGAGFLTVGDPSTGATVGQVVSATADDARGRQAGRGGARRGAVGRRVPALVRRGDPPPLGRDPRVERAVAAPICAPAAAGRRRM